MADRRYGRSPFYYLFLSGWMPVDSKTSAIAGTPEQREPVFVRYPNFYYIRKAFKNRKDFLLVNKGKLTDEQNKSSSLLVLRENNEPL